MVYLKIHIIPKYIFKVEFDTLSIIHLVFIQVPAELSSLLIKSKWIAEYCICPILSFRCFVNGQSSIAGWQM